jgi:pimeloyl-ACP methyl ester carboxylesterase
VHKTSTVVANGVRFFAIEEGTGPLVLLMHGFPDTAHTWDAVRPLIAAAGFRAVSPHMRGYAPTEVPADGRYDSDTLGADVLALIEALGEKQAIVVGHDWGASAAYSAATLGPAKVRLLVTVAIPHPASIVPTPRLAWMGRHFWTLHWKSAVAMVQQNDFAHVDALVRRWSPGWQFPPEETAKVKAAFAVPGSLDAALGYYRAMRPWLPKSNRSKISVPTVSFAGDSDLLEQAAFDRASKWFTAGYRVVRMPGGHFMHREHPGEFGAKLLEVLRSARAPEGESGSAGPLPT